MFQEGYVPSDLRTVLKFEQDVEIYFKLYKSVKVYACRLGLSPRRLNAMLMFYRGKSAGAIIQERVITEAKLLLIHTRMPVFEIAYELGFSDVGYFCRLFKGQTRYTPLVYRNTQTKYDYEQAII
jgi:AraC-like DNA-binding protein